LNGTDPGSHWKNTGNTSRSINKDNNANQLTKSQTHCL
jgi:hypothetical protein